MSRLKSKGSVQARQRTDFLPSNHKTLVHLCVFGTAAMTNVLGYRIGRVGPLPKLLLFH